MKIVIIGCVLFVERLKRGGLFVFVMERRRSMSPLYDWECSRCLYLVELMGRVEEEEKICLVCGGRMIKRVGKITPITRDDKKRKWGTSRISSSLKFQEKRRAKQMKEREE